MQKFSFAIWLAILFLLCQPSASAATLIFAPGDAETVEGSSNNAIPFAGTINSPGTNRRYQQWYSSNLFSTLPGPMWITEIAFRPDAANGNASSGNPRYIDDLEIRFSTTQATNALSSNFANNIGNNQTLVFDGRLDYPVGVPTSGQARPFIYVVTLMTAFLYDPSAGNLLMDVRNISGLTDVVGNMDATNNANLARAWTNAGNGASPTADLTEANYGLVTRFTFATSTSELPEPSTYATIALGISIFAVLRKRGTNR